MEEEKRRNREVSPTAITLRRFREEDAEALARWAGDDRILRYFDAFEEIAGADVSAAGRYIAEELVPHPCFMAVCLGGGGGDPRPVGAVSVTVLPYARDLYRGELGYFVSPELWGRGVATAAVGATVGYIFRRWPHLERLDAVVQVGNGASRRVLEKNGFLQEGLLRKYVHTGGRCSDVFMYALLRSDLGWNDDDDEQPHMIM